MPVKTILSAAVCLGALALASCAPPPSALAPAAAAPKEIVPATTPVEPKVAAMVNGRNIPLDKLHDWLVKAYGVQAMNQLIGTTVVEQAAAAEGVTVNEADVREETGRTLRQMNPNLTPDQYETVLAQLLARKGVPRVQWDDSMRRNAYLRKMVQRKMVVTDAMLLAEFNQRYGQKVQVRLIQCESAADAQKILRALAAGKNFGDLAEKFSTLADSAQEGGLIAPFARDDKMIPKAIRTAAFDLTDGQVSGIIRVDKYFHLIQRARTIAPETDVTFAQVKAELREQVTARLTRQMQTQMLHDLINRADVKLVDPLLKRQAELESTAGR